MTQLDESTLPELTSSEPDVAFARRVRTIMQWIPPGEGATVLDVPCGHGFYLHRYRAAEPMCRVVGVELDDVTARIAHESVGQLGAPIVNGAIERLPFQDAVFDAAIASEVLEHVTDDVAALDEVGRVVRPGGLIAITVPNAAYPFWWDPVNKTLEALTGRHVGRGPLAGIWANHLRLYDRDQLEATVRSADLEMVEMRSFTHHCMPFSHNLIYGIGKPLVERGLLPDSAAHAVDRHRFDRPPPSRWNPVGAATRFAQWFDRRNLPDEPVGVSTVSLAVLARVPLMRSS